MDLDGVQMQPAFVFVRRDLPISLNYETVRTFVGASFTAREMGQPPMLLPDDPPGCVSPFALGKANSHVEREGELLRRQYAPERCSRLGGVFVFASLEDCQRVHDLHHWDLGTVRPGVAVGACNAYDMNIISALNVLPLEFAERQRLWRHYWDGLPGHEYDRWSQLVTNTAFQEPLWEWLVDGVVKFAPDDRSPFEPAPGSLRFEVSSSDLETVVSGLRLQDFEVDVEPREPRHDVAVLAVTSEDADAARDAVSLLASSSREL